MITTNDDIILAADSIEKMSAPDIICFPLYNPDTETALVEVSIRDTDGVHIRYFAYELSKADINLASITTSTNVDKWMEAIEKLIKAKLETLNPSATFTIS